MSTELVLETLKVTVTDHIANLTLTRPEALNAINMAMYADVATAMNAIEDDSSAWVVIVTGEGRSFSVGADLKERQTMTLADVRRRRRLAPQTFGALARCRRPTIAAINGFAFGGGFEIALSCDILLAAQSAQLSLPETALGVIPGGGATQRLPRMIGVHKAKEFIFTGRRIEAEEAFRLGMLNRVLPDAELMPAAQALAEEIRNNAPIAVQQAKRAINGSMNMGLDFGLEFEAEAYQSALSSSDRNEGLAARREKRQPNYTGE